MYAKRDVVLVKFHPSFGMELRKYRPALVLFEPIDARFITILPLSTKARTITSSYDIKVTGEPFDAPSWVLAWHPITIDASRVVKKLGELKVGDYAKISKVLTKLVK